MSTDGGTIQDVSDTALWVAHYRAIESDQPHPLFRDDLAKILAGERGKKIAESMKATSRYTQWTVVIRTVMIDDYIYELIQNGVDTVINLGAGLDTRPYRLQFATPINWVEVDYPHLIAHKEKNLVNEKPNVKLERVSLDLADRKKRQELFARLGAQTKKALILTEGVIPYLTETQVAELAEDLRTQKSFKFWLLEYMSARVYRYVKAAGRTKKMKNSPFVFFPKDWMEFFKNHGWIQHQIRYFAIEAKKLHRRAPFPWWASIFIPFMSKKRISELQTQTGFVLLTPK
jgi:methyltransferase (TIGR00027 family)